MEGRISARALGAATLVLAACILGGCATAPIRLYSGPDLSEQQVATLRADIPIEIKAVDEEAVGKGVSDVALQLLPGKHEVRFGYTHEICFYVDRIRGRECKTFYSGDVQLAFEAAAGHHYKIAVASSMTGWQPYILDTASGQVVAASDRQWPL
jgi:hypothetical protein